MGPTSSSDAVETNQASPTAVASSYLEQESTLCTPAILASYNIFISSEPWENMSLP